MKLSPKQEDWKKRKEERRKEAKIPKRSLFFGPYEPGNFYEFPQGKGLVP